MAKAYIANKPVRFDRNYSVGEIIPTEVIAPKMRRKLVEMGRILCVEAPDVDGAQGAAGQPTDASNGDGGVNTPPAGQDGAEGQQDGQDDGEGDAGTATETTNDTDGENDPEPPGSNAGELSASGEFVCEVCGRAFSSKNGLSAHSRSHK